MYDFLLACAKVAGRWIDYFRGQEPMAREPDVAFLVTTSGSLDIFLTRLLRMKLL